MFGSRDVYVRVSNLNRLEVAKKRDYLVEEAGRGYEQHAYQYKEESNRNGTEQAFMVPG